MFPILKITIFQLWRTNRQFPKVEKKRKKISLFKILHEKLKLRCFLFFRFFFFYKIRKIEKKEEQLIVDFRNNIL